MIMGKVELRIPGDYQWWLWQVMAIQDLKLIVTDEKERLKCQTMSVALDTLKTLCPSDIHRGLKTWSQKELKWRNRRPKDREIEGTVC